MILVRMCRHLRGLIGVSLKIRACKLGQKALHSNFSILFQKYLSNKDASPDGCQKTSPPATRRSSPDAGMGWTHCLHRKKTMKPVSFQLKLLPFYSTRVSDVEDVGHRNV